MTNQAEKPCLSECLCPCHGATCSQKGCPACNPAPKPAADIRMMQPGFPPPPVEPGSEPPMSLERYIEKLKDERDAFERERDAIAAQVKRYEDLISRLCAHAEARAIRARKESEARRG